MPSRPRILVVYKKDAYHQYIQEQQDPHLVRLLRRRDPDVLDMQRAHTIHEEALEAVSVALRRLPVVFDLAYRADLRVTKQYDLVVSVGGDGTFLQAARSVQNTPLLGVNSDPSRSEAVFCAANRRTFPAMIRLALAGKLPALRLHRLRLALNGRPLPHRALNDVLVVHDDPATMSRYRLRLGRREEFQKPRGSGYPPRPAPAARSSRPAACSWRGGRTASSTARASCTAAGFRATG
jgi:NAD kinase